MADTSNSSYGFSDGDGYGLDSNYGDWGYGNQQGQGQVPNYITDPTSAPGVMIPLFGAEHNQDSPLIQLTQPTIAQNKLIGTETPQSFVQGGGAGNTAQNSTINGLAGAGAISGNPYIGGASALVGAYSNASDDTGSSVLSGAASGAAAGAAFGPWGMAIGAVVGGISGFFGSKSKKKQEKKAFQQQEQLAVLPQQQQEANYLMNEGLKQKAMSNYSSGYQPGGYKMTNALLGSGGGSANYKLPSSSPSLPNFNQPPPNVVPGSGDKSLGISGQSIPNNGVNLNPNHAPIGATGFVAPSSTIGWTPAGMPTAPTYTKDKNAQTASLNQYSTDYTKYLNDQNQQAIGNAMNAYSGLYG